MNSDTLSVMIVEDNADYRSAVELALNTENDMGLTSQFSTAEAAIRALEDGAATPDVILLDLRLPGMNGNDSIPLMLKASPGSGIIILTQSAREPDVVQAIEHGASGYLLKSALSLQLVGAIRAVAKGDAMIDSSVAKFVFDRISSKSSRKDSLLSERETEVLKLLAQGLVKKEIAAHLEIAYSTVDTHVTRIYAKLKVNNAPAAVNRAHLLKLFS